jgi:hypothetical protein
LSAFVALGVGQPASRAASVKVVPVWWVVVFAYPATPELAPSCRVGVGQPDRSEVEALSDVRRTDARSAQIGGPDRIAQCFQVNAYSVEPRPASLARNLLSKDDWREALADEPEPLFP